MAVLLCAQPPPTFLSCCQWLFLITVRGCLGWLGGWGGRWWSWSGRHCCCWSLGGWWFGRHCDGSYCWGARHAVRCRWFRIRVAMVGSWLVTVAAECDGLVIRVAHGCRLGRVAAKVLMRGPPRPSSRREQQHSGLMCCWTEAGTSNGFSAPPRAPSSQKNENLMVVVEWAAAALT
jgi:hypothetical protein